jgi:succinoglycan biosynthesis transport protein ExoP
MQAINDEQRLPLNLMHTAVQEQPFGLRDYLAVIWARKWIIALVTFLAVGSAFFYTSRQIPTYQSSATVRVLATGSETSVSSDSFNMLTERELAVSALVAEHAADRLDEDAGPGALLGGLTVDVLPETEILRFTYSSTDPTVSQERANAFASGYLDYRRAQAIDELLATNQAIQEQIDEVEADLQRVSGKLASAQDVGQQATLEAERDANSARLSVLQSQLIAAPSEIRVGQVVQRAILPTVPLGKDYPRNIILGLLVGLGLGAGIAFVIERLDDRLKGRADLERHSTAPVLAVVPKIAGLKKQRETPFLPTLDEPNSAAAEAYRTLRTGILFAASQRPIRAIMVTSAEAGEGKTTTTANLGIAMARAGKKVIILSADLRRPRIQDYFSLSNGYGLTNVLAGEKGISEALRRPRGLMNLKVLASGPIPGNPGELLSSTAMTKALNELKNQADFVLIDATPILSVSDALAMTGLVDGVLLVADAQRTSRAAVEQTRHQLHQVHANIIGSVLNNFDPKKAAGHYTSTYYRYEAEDRTV